MRIPREEISSLIASTPKICAQRPSRAKVNRLVDELRLELRRDIDRHMQPWMVLLDEAVRFFVYFERYQYSRKLSRNTSPFALQLSRIRSDVLSLRELIALGQEGPAHTIARCFVDGIELAMALAEDPAFAVAYTEAEDESEFWKRHIGYGKIYGRVESFFRRTGGTVDQASEHISRHKEVKNALSGHVHIASYSAFRSAAVPSITHPGMLHMGALGSLSIHMPRLCHFIADETHIFAACCINAFIRPNPPPVFANYRPTKKLHDAVASAHVLQELLARHGDTMEQLSDSLMNDNDSDDAI
jgi:hypothetical protein